MGNKPYYESGDIIRMTIGFDDEKEKLIKTVLVYYRKPYEQIVRQDSLEAGLCDYTDYQNNFYVYLDMDTAQVCHGFLGSSSGVCMVEKL